MSLRHWSARLGLSTGNRGGRRRARRRRIQVEGLESRALLATLYVAPGGADTNSGGINSPFRNIQAAVTAARSGDEIRVAAGTYTYAPSTDSFGPGGQSSYSTILGSTPVVAVIGKQLSILGGFSTADWSTSNPQANPTVIDGQGSHRGVFILGQQGATNLTLDGFTVQNGLAQGLPNRVSPDNVYAFGGGIFVDMGGNPAQPYQFVFSNLVFRTNRAVSAGAISGEGGRAAGGAIELRYATHVVLLNDLFDSNYVVGADAQDAGGSTLGGALAVDHSNVVGNGLIFRGNFAQSGTAPTGSGTGQVDGVKADALGGAVAIGAASDVSMTDVRAENNQALGGGAAGEGGGGFGGAFFVEGADALLRLTRAYLVGNKAQGGDGAKGGLVGGGAVETHNGGLIMDSSQVYANVAQSGNSTNGGAAGAGGGGGLYLTRFTGNAPSTLTNTVIAGNVVTIGQGNANSGGGGGGLWFQGTPATLTHVTIDANRLDPRLAFGEAILLNNFSTPTPATVNVNYSIISNHTNAQHSVLEVFPGSQLNFNRALSFNNAGLAGFTAGTITGLNTVTTAAATAATPNLYVAPGAPGFDYHLNRAVPNPAVGAAVGSTTPVDLEGTARGKAPDLGAYQSIAPPPPPPAPAVVVLHADYDGDHKADIGVYDRTTATFTIVKSSGGVIVQQFGDPSHNNIPVVGDYYGTGQTDLGIYDATTSTLIVVPPAGIPGLRPLIQQFGDPSHRNIPVAGDYDGDGKTDLGIYDATTSTLIVAKSNLTGAIIQQFGDPSHNNIPVTGDYDGDHKTDLGIFDATTSTLIVAKSNLTGAIIQQFGDPSHNNIPVVGDYYGTGQTDLGIFDATTSTLIVVPPAGTTGLRPLIQQFGDPSHKNIALGGDYDGDGKTDLGIFDRTTASFVIVKSRGGVIIQQFGNPLDENFPT